MTEAQHQEALFQWAAVNAGKYPELALLFHIPNGGSRNPAEAAHLKRLGVKAGVPDLFLPVARGGYHGLYIELKAGKGTASQRQKWWLEQLNRQGYCARVCHGWETAADVVRWYFGLDHG